MPVGIYVSDTRKIVGKKNADGHITFTVLFEGGLRNGEDAKTYGAKYPLRKWLSTKPYSLPDTPGKTSSVAEYLRSVGFNPKGMTIGDILDAVEQSQFSPVHVFVGRTDRGVKQPDGTWAQKNLKTRDFNIGTKESPVYAESVVIDGTTYQAAPTVTSFSPVAA